MDYTNAYEISMKAYEIWHNNPGKSYQEKKAEAQQFAKDLQRDLAEQITSYEDLAVIQDSLYKLARRTGLVSEWTLNGIL